jgi:hypothetical protein
MDGEGKSWTLLRKLEGERWTLFLGRWRGGGWTFPGKVVDEKPYKGERESRTPLGKVEK